MPYSDTFCVEGGGVKGIAYVGVIRALEEWNVLPQIQNFCGSSAGAMACILLVAGYTAKEIRHILVELNFNRFRNRGYFWPFLWRLYKKGALYDGSELEKWINEHLFAKFAIAEITMAELYRETGKNLVLTGTCVETSKTVYFSRHNYPNTPVAKIGRITMSIPGIWDPVELNGQHFVDGGMLVNYPIQIFATRIDRIIGAKLIAGDEFYDAEHGKIAYDEPKLKNGLDFTLQYISIFMHALENQHMNEQFWARTIPIPTAYISATNFDISIETRKKLITDGYNAAIKWLEMNYFHSDT